MVSKIDSCVWFQDHRTSQLPLDLDNGEDDTTSLKSDTEVKCESVYTLYLHSKNKVYSAFLDLKRFGFKTINIILCF